MWDRAGVGSGTTVVAPSLYDGHGLMNAVEIESVPMTSTGGQYYGSGVVRIILPGCPLTDQPASEEV